MARWAPPGMKKDGPLDPDAVEGAEETPYAFPAQRTEWVRDEPSALTTLWWRGVGPMHNVFVVESFVDELASAAGRDPVESRRALLPANNPRAFAVLNLAAEKAGWGTALSEGAGRGVALQFSFGTLMATVAEVVVDRADEVQLRRLTVALGCGPVVNPDTVMAQVQGGLVFGLSTAPAQANPVRHRPVDGGMRAARGVGMDKACLHRVGAAGVGSAGDSADRRSTAADGAGVVTSGAVVVLPVVARADAGDLVKKGKYLTRAADCAACHALPGGEAWVGGRKFMLPIGVMKCRRPTWSLRLRVARRPDRRWCPTPAMPAGWARGCSRRPAPAATCRRGGAAVALGGAGRGLQHRGFGGGQHRCHAAAWLADQDQVRADVHARLHRGVYRDGDDGGGELRHRALLGASGHSDSAGLQAGGVKASKARGFASGPQRLSLWNPYAW